MDNMDNNIKNDAIKTEPAGIQPYLPAPRENDYLVQVKEDITIDALIQKILDGEKQYDLSKIVEAYKLAEKYHHDQKRESGEPYISHPLSVAYILLELGMDTDTRYRVHIAGA